MTEQDKDKLWRVQKWISTLKVGDLVQVHQAPTDDKAMAEEGAIIPGTFHVSYENLVGYIRIGKNGKEGFLPFYRDTGWNGFGYCIRPIGGLKPIEDELRAIGDKARFSTEPSVCRQMYDGQFIGCTDDERDGWHIGHLNMRELTLMRDMVKGEDSPAVFLFEGDWANFKFAAYQFDSEVDARRFFEARKVEMAADWAKTDEIEDLQKRLDAKAKQEQLR